MLNLPTKALDPAKVREAREDRLDKGGVRPARFLYLPAPLSMLLLTAAYLIQISFTGWAGIRWAAAIVGPIWFLAYFAVANDPYGCNVAYSWFRCCWLLKDEGFGGKTLAPKPARSSLKIRGMFHAG